MLFRSRWQNPSPNANIAIFTSSTTWTAPTGATSVEYLVVAGGGGGGGANWNGTGGGGAGGFRIGAGYSVTAGNTYTVTVGSGGNGGSGPAGSNGSNGSNSVFDNITSNGGGGGGAGVSTSSPLAGRLSHIEVLRKIKPLENVLICEDDAVFRDDFNEVIDEYMADLPPNWDIFYLGALKNQVAPMNKHWVRQIETTGSHAYCVNPDKVDLFIHIARENEKWIDVAYRLWCDRTNAYIAHPNLVIQSDGYSDLRESETQDFKGFK